MAEVSPWGRVLIWIFLLAGIVVHFAINEAVVYGLNRFSRAMYETSMCPMPFVRDDVFVFHPSVNEQSLRRGDGFDLRPIREWERSWHVETAVWHHKAATGRHKARPVSWMGGESVIKSILHVAQNDQSGTPTGVQEKEIRPLCFPNVPETSFAQPYPRSIRCNSSPESFLGNLSGSLGFLREFSCRTDKLIGSGDGLCHFVDLRFSGVRLFPSRDGQRMGINSTALHLPQLPLHGTPLKSANNNSAKPEECDGSGQPNHPLFSTSHTVFEQLYLGSIWISAYGCCCYGSWLLWRQWRIDSLNIRVLLWVLLLYGLSAVIIWHGFIVTQKLLDKR